jgi:hypothetical protein
MHVQMLNAEGEACLTKPYKADDLIRGMKIVAEIVANGASSSPFPHGFRLLQHPYSQPMEHANG